MYSFLIGRKQRVTINAFESTWADVVVGVPQGSVLGSIFFLMYINDLPLMLSNPCLLSADTPKFIIMLGVRMIYQLQQNIDELQRWWQMPFMFQSENMGRSNLNHVYSMDHNGWLWY